MEKMIWKERWPRLKLRRQREGLSHYPEHPELEVLLCYPAAPELLLWDPWMTGVT